MPVFLCNIRQFFTQLLRLSCTCMLLFARVVPRRLPCFVRGVMGKTLLFMCLLISNPSKFLIVPSLQHQLQLVARLSENTTHQMFSVYTTPEQYKNATITIPVILSLRTLVTTSFSQSSVSENVSRPHENFSSLRGVFERMA